MTPATPTLDELRTITAEPDTLVLRRPRKERKAPPEPPSVKAQRLAPLLKPATARPRDSEHTYHGWSCPTSAWEQDGSLHFVCPAANYCSCNLNRKGLKECAHLKAARIREAQNESIYVVQPSPAPAGGLVCECCGVELPKTTTTAICVECMWRRDFECETWDPETGRWLAA